MSTRLVSPLALLAALVVPASTASAAPSEYFESFDTIPAGWTFAVTGTPFLLGGFDPLTHGSHLQMLAEDDVGSAIEVDLTAVDSPPSLVPGQLYRVRARFITSLGRPALGLPTGEVAPFESGSTLGVTHNGASIGTVQLSTDAIVVETAAIPDPGVPQLWNFVTFYVAHPRG